MKRDMDIFREILFIIEKSYIDKPLTSAYFENIDISVLAEHCNLLIDEGLIRDLKISRNDGYCIYEVRVFGLTSKGFDFLESIKNDTVWNKIKKVTLKEAIPLSVNVINDILVYLITN